MTGHELARLLLSLPESDDVRVDASGTDEGGSWPVRGAYTSHDGHGPVVLLDVNMP